MKLMEIVNVNAHLKAAMLRGQGIQTTLVRLQPWVSWLTL